MSLILIECPVCQTDRTVEYFQDEQLNKPIYNDLALELRHSLFPSMYSCSGGRGRSAITLKAYKPAGTDLTDDLIVDVKA